MAKIAIAIVCVILGVYNIRNLYKQDRMEIKKVITKIGFTIFCNHFLFICKIKANILKSLNLYNFMSCNTT